MAEAAPISGSAPPAETAGTQPDRPDPDFEVIGAEAVPRSAAPALRFDIDVSDVSGIPVQFIALSVLITIEPGRRSYSPEERERLVDLFGEPERWGSTTGAFRWTQIDTVVGPFTGRGRHRIAVPCTYDHEIATTKYFAGVGDGTYPLQFHFSGTVHYDGSDGRMQILPLAWDRSTRFDLPVATWRQMIDAHYPHGAWIALSEETLERLTRRKGETGSPTIEDCVRDLLGSGD